MKKFLLFLLFIPVWCFAQTPVTPQFQRKIPSDSILRAKTPQGTLLLPDTSWVKKYSGKDLIAKVTDFEGAGTTSSKFGLRDTLLKIHWVINSTDTLNPTLTVISDQAQPGLLVKAFESIDGRAVVHMRSSKNNQWWEVGTNPAGQNKAFGIRRMNGVALPNVDYLWYVEPLTDTSVFPHQVRFPNARAYTSGDSVAYLKNGFIEIGPAPTGGSFSLTTIGMSGPATYSGGVLNIPQYAGTTYTASGGVGLSGSDFRIASGTLIGSTVAISSPITTNFTIGSNSSGNTSVLQLFNNVLQLTSHKSGLGTVFVQLTNSSTDAELKTGYQNSTGTLSKSIIYGVTNRGILHTDIVDTVGDRYADTSYAVNGKRYDTWIPTWKAVKSRVDSAVNAHTSGITALTGDVTASGTGSVAATLATVNSNVGSFGDATHVAAITVNAKGLTTAVTSTAITFPVTLSNSVALTNKDLSGAGNIFPTFNQNTTGTASNITATSNSTLTTLSALSLPYSQLTGAPSLTGYVPYTGATGNVNLGTNFIAAGASLTPLAPIHAISTISTNPRGVLSDQNTADAVGARITMRKSRGTPASPTVITTADVLGSWTAAGYDGTNYIDAAKVLVTSTGTIGTNQVPAIMELQTANASGTLIDGIKIDQAQALTFGAYGTGILHSGSAGAITSSAVNLAGADVTGLLPNGNLANSTISGISLGSNLAALTATDATLTFSGSYTGATARTVGLNLAQPNTWTAAPTVNLATAASATYGTVFSSATAATSGNQKWSPFIQFTGSQWRTDLGASAASSGDIGWQPLQSGGQYGQMVIRGQFGSSTMATIAIFDPQGISTFTSGAGQVVATEVNPSVIRASTNNTSFNLLQSRTFNASGDGILINPGQVTNSTSLFSPMHLTQTLNQSSTASYTAWLTNLTETATGSGGVKFVDYQIAGTSKYSVKDDGTINSAALTASKVVFTDASKNLTSTGIGTSSQYIAADGSLGTIGARPHIIFTPTTGATISLTNNQYNIINPSGSLVSLTVNLPSSPANNDCVFIKYTQSITTVTYANGTVVDGITAPTAGGLVVLTYDSGTTSWY